MRFPLFVLVLFAIPSLWAGIDLGLGFNSATSGRMIPALVGGAAFSDSRLSGSMTGVKSGYYYHSSYNLNYYKTWKAGDLFFGEMESGFGIGGLYAIRSFQDDGSLTASTKSDFVLGPAFEMQWLFTRVTYVSLEMLWGIRELTNHLALNAQDVVTFSG